MHIYRLKNLVNPFGLLFTLGAHFGAAIGGLLAHSIGWPFNMCAIVGLISLPLFLIMLVLFTRKEDWVQTRLFSQFNNQTIFIMIAGYLAISALALISLFTNTILFKLSLILEFMSFAFLISPFFILTKDIKLLTEGEINNFVRNSANAICLSSSSALCLLIGVYYFYRNKPLLGTAIFILASVFQAIAIRSILKLQKVSNIN